MKIKKISFLFFVIFFQLLLTTVQAAAFFETGETSVTTTVDNGGWVTVNTQKTYVSPVVIAGPVSHNNDNSLSVRVRNVGTSSFQIGYQSPCESYNQFSGTSPPAANTCPSSAYLSETIQWMVVEQGTWVFPDGTKIEAYLHSTSTIRSKGGGNANNADAINFSHTYVAAPAVLHTVNTFNDANWIATSAWEQSTSRGNPPGTSSFNLALEGAEATTSHGSESIGWVAIEIGTGTNNTFDYSAGRTAGRNVDRHNDECELLSFGLTFSGVPNVVAQHNSIGGGDGGWIRSCVPILPDTGAPIQTNQFFVHLDEDQVSDIDRQGAEEYVAWFAFEQGSFGVLEFLTATKSVADEDSDGVIGPGELVTYTVVITNQQDDFAQVNNAASTEPEFVDPIDSNFSFESIVSASTGTLTFDAVDDRFEWQGTIPASGVVTLVYRVTVRDLASICSLSNIPNQGVLNMDPIDDAVEVGDTDNLNRITELTDDTSRDDGIDSDLDGSTDDDDETLINVDCLSDLSLNKNDASASYTPGDASLVYTIVVTNSGPHNLIGATVNDILPAGLSLNGVVSCSVTTGTGTCGTQTVVGSNISQVINLADASSITINIPVIYSTDPSDY